MKFFLKIVIIGAIVVTGLYFIHEGVFYKKNDEASANNAQYTEAYYALPPSLFLKIIKNNDLDNAAGILHTATFDITRSDSFSKFKSLESRLDHQWIYNYDMEPNTYFYVFDLEATAIQFFDSVKSSLGAVLIYAPTKKNPIYKLDSCVFEYLGYSIKNEGFRIMIYPYDSKKKSTPEPKKADSVINKNKDSIQHKKHSKIDETGDLGEVIDNSQKSYPTCFNFSQKSEFDYKMDDQFYIKFYKGSRTGELEVIFFVGKINGDRIESFLGKRNDDLTENANGYHLRFAFSDDCETLTCYYYNYDWNRNLQGDYSEKKIVMVLE